jgi:hypothetical protein
MHGGDPAARVTFAFRSVLSRSPSPREQAVLEDLLRSSRERYLRDPEAAIAVTANGNAPRQQGADSVEVAAWTAVASALLNLDEAITRE